MANPVCEVLLTDEEVVICPGEFPEGAGGVVDFWGVVRPVEDGRAIDGIDYEAHRPMAEHQLLKISGEAADRFPLRYVRVVHRVGFVRAGDASLLVRCASKHRAEAFAATQWIVEQLKQRVPIWKHARFSETAAASV